MDMELLFCGVLVYAPAFAGTTTHCTYQHGDGQTEFIWMTGDRIYTKSSLPAHRQSPIHVLTGPGVD